MDRVVNSVTESARELSLDLWHSKYARSARQHLGLVCCLDAHTIATDITISVKSLGYLLATFMLPLDWILTMSIPDDLPEDAKISPWLHALNWVYEAAWNMAYLIEFNILIRVLLLLYIFRQQVTIVAIYVFLLVFVAASLLCQSLILSTSWIWGKARGYWSNLEYPIPHDRAAADFEQEVPHHLTNPGYMTHRYETVADLRRRGLRCRASKKTEAFVC